MANTRAILLAFTRCNVPDREQEWSDWYDDQHLPDLFQAGTPKVATRWELTQKPEPMMPSIGFSYVAIYEFDGADVDAEVEAFLARDAALREAGRLHRNHCVIGVDVLLAHGTPTKPEPSEALEGHILAYVMSNQPDREAEWDAWYDAVHLPDMMDSEAFSAGTRWKRREPAPWGANYITLYDVSGIPIEEAVARSAAVMPDLTAAGRKLDCHVGAMAITLRASCYIIEQAKAGHLN